MPGNQRIVTNVAGRRRHDFRERSRVRTNAQTRAQIESPRERVPCTARRELFATTQLSKSDFGGAIEQFSATVTRESQRCVRTASTKIPPLLRRPSNSDQGGYHPSRDRETWKPTPPRDAAGARMSVTAPRSIQPAALLSGSFCQAVIVHGS